jgi:predicted glycosyltransferase
VSRRPRLLFYCQHSVGLGHLVRSFALCRALAERFEVVLTCGGSLPRGIEVPAGVRLVPLPALGVGPEGRFVSHDPALTVEEATKRRRALLVETLREVRPDVVLVELFPFGRAKFARELLPFLAEARALGPRRPFVACSLRDILVTGRPNQAAHDERACEIANRWFDAILVHAERRFAPLEASFRPRTPLTVPVHYTGYVVPNGHRPAAEPPAHAGRIVVSAGGGLVGAPLLRAALGAHRLLWPAERRPMTLIGGPFLPEPAWRALRAEAEACEGVDVRRSVPDLGEALRGAAASVSQCGYNTALEVLRAGLPALVVPYATPEEDEQRRRARLLEAMGALRVLTPERLSAAALAEELRALAAFAPARAPLDLDGARRTPALLARLAADGGAPAADAAGVALADAEERSA